MALAKVGDEGHVAERQRAEHAERQVQRAEVMVPLIGHGHEIAQPEGHAPGQRRVAREACDIQVGEVAQLLREVSAQLVHGQVKYPQAGELPQPGRDWPGQLVVPQGQEFQVHEAAQVRNRSAQLIVGQVQFDCRLVRSVQRGRDRPPSSCCCEATVVARLVRLLRVRDRPAQLVVIESELPQAGEAVQRGPGSSRPTG